MSSNLVPGLLTVPGLETVKLGGGMTWEKAYMLSTSYPYYVYCQGMIHQDLQAGKTGFKSGYYVTSKHIVPKYIYDCMLLTPQFCRDQNMTVEGLGMRL